MDEGDVLKLLSTITSGLMTNPFSCDEEENDDETLPLINIAVGVVMPPDHAKCLLQSYKLGEAQMKMFVEQRLKTCKVVFWIWTPNLKSHTFDTLAKTKVIGR